jgi:inner membrane protein
MFIGHLPAGFLMSRAIASLAPAHARGVMAAGLIASIAPDTDLLWFYLVDARQTHHHAFITHRPVVWIGLAAAGLLLAALLRRGWIAVAAATVLANALLHMALDSIAGQIAWFWPLSDRTLTLVEVPAQGGWWVWNFVFHWTFAVELAVVAAALAALWRWGFLPRQA